MKDTTAIVCTSALVRMIGAVVIALQHGRPESVDATVGLVNATLDNLQTYYDKEKS